VGLGEAAEAVHQPLGGEIWRCRDGEDAGALSLQQSLGAGGEVVKRIADDLEVSATRLGDNEPLALAVEKAKPEFGLKSLHLVTDCALGDAQFARRPSKALVAGRASKALSAFSDGRRRGKGRPEFMSKTRAG
jgi:hypothetical protein